MDTPSVGIGLPAQREDRCGRAMPSNRWPWPIAAGQNQKTFLTHRRSPLRLLQARQMRNASLPQNLDFPNVEIQERAAPAFGGIETVVLKGDPNQRGVYTIMLRVPAHTQIAAHSHRDDRVATVISGTWRIGYGDKFDESKLKPLPPGSFYTRAIASFSVSKWNVIRMCVRGIRIYGQQEIAKVAGRVFIDVTRLRRKQGQA